MRTLIITGGTVNIEFFLKGFFYKDNEYSYCMGVDKGAEYAITLVLSLIWC